MGTEEYAEIGTTEELGESETEDESYRLEIEEYSEEESEILESEARNSKRVENNGFKARELRRYCCKLCGLIRSKRILLKNHIQSEHCEEMGSDDEVDKFIAKKCSEDDQRHYSCQICGVVRSKRRILKLHIISSHGPDALKENRFDSERVGERSQSVCDLCGTSFKKPSHLQQHKLSHSALEGLRYIALLSTRWETALEEL
ncbi:hypothetical protein KI387_006417, partial [Taxus chinensis]